MPVEAYDYEFWKMILSSPATITGILAGSILTFIVSLLTNSHDKKMKYIEFEYQEKRRREERIFNLKNEAYKNIIIKSDKVKKIISKANKEDRVNDFKKLNTLLNEVALHLEEELSIVLIYSEDSMYVYISEAIKKIKEFKKLMKKVEKSCQENSILLEDFDNLKLAEFPKELQPILKDLGTTAYFLELLCEEILQKIREDIKLHHA